MLDAIGVAIVFLGISSLVAVPLAVLLGLPLTAWLGGRWLQLREREVDLRRLEVAGQLREARLLPPWVDREDPAALLAWAQTDRELAALTDRNAH
ncbi:MAG: hypothetical protein R3F59_07520 [Myxococcota bacterium]